MINVKIDQFEGPFGMLLKMIETEKLDITEVNLAKIADQYIEHIKNNDISPEILADFLVIAAKLLYIKSRTLLPYLFPDEDDDSGDLENQLRMYREFLKATKVIEEMVAAKNFLFSPVNTIMDRADDFKDLFIFSPPRNLNMTDLRNAFVGFVDKRRPKQEALREETIEYKISIEEKILAIENSLLDRLKTSFSNILKSSKSKTEIIVNFLALLELMKQKTIGVQQGELFSEITIHRNK